MSNLKKYRFCELYEMSSGISSKPEQAGHGNPFLSFSTVFNNYFLPESLPDLMDSSEKEQESYSIKKGDVFLTRTSETLDELGMSCVALKEYPKATYSGFVKRLRPIQEHITYEKYMGFYLRSNFFRKTMTNNAIMTLRASLNEEIFSYLNLYLPSYESQKKIGDTLFLINRKIELNNRINTELVALAKTVYDYWFVQFDFPDKDGRPYKSSGGKMVWNDELKREIPEGWYNERIDSKLKIGSGFPFDSSCYEPYGKYKVITIKNVQDLQLDTSRIERIDSLPTNIPEFCKLSLGDILISLTGNVGRICLTTEDNLLLNQRVGTFICDKLDKNYLFFFFQRKEVQTWLKNIATGSSQKNLSPIDATNYHTVFPSSEILDKFNSIVDSLISQLILNQIENQELWAFHDWALPMLMNGQVKVVDAEEE
ncbi:MAG: restriction endonuclease subunit S [Bacteroidetes bacterium]|nr:restriction endonuclease subunit S [Bacteroidota bacterium]